MRRVVYDTNVIVSAALKPGSLPAALVTLALRQQVQLCVSDALLAEYTEVLNRPKFGLEARAVATLLAALTAGALIVQPTERITAARDASDDPVLECAVAAAADFLVTGNLKHFPAPTFRGIAIVTPAEGLARLLA